MRDVPYSRSAVTTTAGNIFEWRKIRCICIMRGHRLSTRVDLVNLCGYPPPSPVEAVEQTLLDAPTSNRPYLCDNHRRSPASISHRIPSSFTASLTVGPRSSWHCIPHLRAGFLKRTVDLNVGRTKLGASTAAHTCAPSPSSTLEGPTRDEDDTAGVQPQTIRPRADTTAQTVAASMNIGLGRPPLRFPVRLQQLARLWWKRNDPLAFTQAFYPSRSGCGGVQAGGDPSDTMARMTIFTPNVFTDAAFISAFHQAGVFEGGEAGWSSSDANRRYTLIADIRAREEGESARSGTLASTAEKAFEGRHERMGGQRTKMWRCLYALSFRRPPGYLGHIFPSYAQLAIGHDRVPSPATSNQRGSSTRGVRAVRCGGVMALARGVEGQVGARTWMAINTMQEDDGTPSPPMSSPPIHRHHNSAAAFRRLGEASRRLGAIGTMIACDDHPRWRGAGADGDGEMEGSDHVRGAMSERYWQWERLEEDGEYEGVADGDAGMISAAPPLAHDFSLGARARIVRKGMVSSNDTLFFCSAVSSTAAFNDDLHHLILLFGSAERSSTESYDVHLKSAFFASPPPALQCNDPDVLFHWCLLPPPHYLPPNIVSRPFNAAAPFLEKPIPPNTATSQCRYLNHSAAKYSRKLQNLSMVGRRITFSCSRRP
ncbi:hypothetical protein B0H16DRAFT_1811967 [Mycena metata]|uniref:Uncharacterized protein n=1 Tax=Mycena metata TaxID=1033252 RepID=A0AAD7H5T9_9AGAR|nr:hypothetical protein B0H16DRAFT_1811967 [Mycena metata]